MVLTGGDTGWSTGSSSVRTWEEFPGLAPPNGRGGVGLGWTGTGSKSGMVTGDLNRRRRSVRRGWGLGGRGLREEKYSWTLQKDFVFILK